MQKLKQVIERFSSFPNFFEDLLKCLRQEKDYRMVNVVMKKSTQQFHHQTPQAKYALLLTTYAYQMIIKQINLSTKVSIENPSDLVYITTSFGGEIQVTPSVCTCCNLIFSHVATFLPCVKLGP